MRRPCPRFTKPTWHAIPPGPQDFDAFMYTPLPLSERSAGPGAAFPQPMPTFSQVWL
jgi:hypothetical protein